MAETALTIEVLDETAQVTAKVGLDGMENADADDGNSFVNTGKTFLAIHADGHNATAIATISPDSSTVDTDRYGELDVDDIVVTVPASDSDPQWGFVKIPTGYNSAGKVNIAWTSGGDDWEEGEVTVCAVRLK